MKRISVHFSATKNQNLLFFYHLNNMPFRSPNMLVECLCECPQVVCVQCSCLLNQCRSLEVKYVQLQLLKIDSSSPPVAIVLCCLHSCRSIWRVSLSLFPGAEALPSPAGNHRGVYRSSSCTGPRFPRRESLLPRLGTGAERHGPPFHRAGHSWGDDTQRSKPETRLIILGNRKEKTRESCTYEDMLVLACSWMSSPLGLTVKILFSGTPTSL